LDAGMAKTPKKKSSEPEIEIDPDALERFRGAVHALAKAKPHHREAVKSGPKHRTVSKPGAEKKTKSK
jgi:hypothetical protein